MHDYMPRFGLKTAVLMTLSLQQVQTTTATFSILTGLTPIMASRRRQGDARHSTAGHKLPTFPTQLPASSACYRQGGRSLIDQFTVGFKTRMKPGLQRQTFVQTTCARNCGRSAQQKYDADITTRVHNSKSFV